jgi:hypothetical protein
MRHILFALTVIAAPAVANAQDVTPFADPSRLVTIGGSLTEIVFELGAEDYLVARDSTGTYPEAATELPDVGYMRALAPEGVLSVEPTAILMLEGAGPLEAIEVLESASVPIVTVPETFDAAGVATKVQMVGAALGLDEAAEELNARIAADFAAVEELTAQNSERKSVLFILSMTGRNGGERDHRAGGRRQRHHRIRGLQAVDGGSDHHRQSRRHPDDGSGRGSLGERQRASQSSGGFPDDGRAERGNCPHRWRICARVRSARRVGGTGPLRGHIQPRKLSHEHDCHKACHRLRPPG